MPKTLSSTEAKNKFGEVLDSVARNDEDVIIETHGKPKAALIPIERYEQYQELAQRERRRTALNELEKLRAEVSARNQDLTEAEADKIADEITREAIDSLFRKGIVRYGE